MKPPIPTFYYGPKDGAPVPEMMWVLDVIRFSDISKDGMVVHKYVCNDEDHNYYYKGAFKAGREIDE